MRHSFYIFLQGQHGTRVVIVGDCVNAACLSAVKTLHYCSDLLCIPSLDYFSQRWCLVSCSHFCSIPSKIREEASPPIFSSEVRGRGAISGAKRRPLLSHLRSRTRRGPPSSRPRSGGETVGRCPPPVVRGPEARREAASPVVRGTGARPGAKRRPPSFRPRSGARRRPPSCEIQGRGARRRPPLSEVPGEAAASSPSSEVPEVRNEVSSTLEVCPSSDMSEVRFEASSTVARRRRRPGTGTKHLPRPRRRCASSEDQNTLVDARLCALIWSAAEAQNRRPASTVVRTAITHHAWREEQVWGMGRGIGMLLRGSGQCLQLTLGYCTHHGLWLPSTSLKALTQGLSLSL